QRHPSVTDISLKKLLPVEGLGNAVCSQQHSGEQQHARLRIPKLLENFAYAHTLCEPGEQRECQRGAQDPAHRWREFDFQADRQTSDEAGSTSKLFARWVQILLTLAAWNLDASSRVATLSVIPAGDFDGSCEADTRDSRTRAPAHRGRRCHR